VYFLVRATRGPMVPMVVSKPVLIVALVATACSNSRPTLSPELVSFYQLPPIEQKAVFVTLDPRIQLEIAHHTYWGEPRIEWFADTIAAETHLLPFLSADLTKAADDARIELIAYILQHMAARYRDVANYDPVMNALRNKRRTMKSELAGSQVDGWMEQISYHHLNDWAKTRSTPKD